MRHNPPHSSNEETKGGRCHPGAILLLSGGNPSNAGLPCYPVDKEGLDTYSAGLGITNYFKANIVPIFLKNLAPL